MPDEKKEEIIEAKKASDEMETTVEEVKPEVKKEAKEQKVRVKYINQKCGLKISKDLEFLPNDTKPVGIKMATTLLTDYYQQFEGCDSITRGIHKAVVEKVKATQAKIAKKAEAAAKKK